MSSNPRLDAELPSTTPPADRERRLRSRPSSASGGRQGRTQAADRIADRHLEHPERLVDHLAELDARWIGSVRRELLDHVVVFHERHLRQLLQEYVANYHDDRPHLALNKDAPSGRPVERPPEPAAEIVSFPRVGGLHHRYGWRAAA